MGEWFNAPGWVNASVPVIATPGNHEYSRDRHAESGSPRLSSFWQPQFTFPQKWTRGSKESCYYIDYQGVRIISLNSNEENKKSRNNGYGICFPIIRRNGQSLPFTTRYFLQKQVVITGITQFVETFVRRI
jgi:hypothetical protein